MSPHIARIMSLMAASFFACSFTGSFAQERPTLSAAELKERTIHRRAVEAIIWGMPAVNYERMLQVALARAQKKPNEMIYWSRPVNWKTQTLTPNPDTIYFQPFYDTRSGPVVIEIPPATDDNVIVGSIDDAWQNALTDVGPTGEDQGKGGKYLITPPGYEGKTPEGYIVLPSQTYRGFAILRSNFKSRSEADIADAVAHGKRVKIYPLNASADRKSYFDMYDKPFDATIPYDETFFEALNHFVQAEPWLTRDKVMIEYLETLGIEKGMPFNPDEKMKRIYAEAAREAHAQIGQTYEAGFLSPFFPSTHWALPIPKKALDGMATLFADPDSYAIGGRAAIYHMAYFSAKHLGAGQFYLLAIRDSTGQPLDGKKTYRLNVPAEAPVKQYWSATAYDRETHALIREVSRASLASNADNVQKNADGSVDVYFGPKPPTGKEANWVPTKDRDFEILFRFYGPEKSLFDKTWALPDIEMAQ
jgi:hypothetical protein